MSFKDCLNSAAQSGAISQERKDAALKMYEQMRSDLIKSGHGISTAEHLASQEVTAYMSNQVAGKQKALVLAMAAKERGIQGLAAAGDRPVKGLTDMVVKNQQRAALIKQRWAGMLDKVFDRYAKGNFLGKFFAKEVDRDMLGKELFGEKTGSQPHAELAEQIKNVNADIVKRSNEAGAAIAEKENYGIPMDWDAVGMKKAGFEKFFSDMQNGLDLTKMKDIEGRKLSSYSPQELRTWMEGRFKNIVTDSWTKASRSPASLADRISQRRYFEFKDYDSWKGANKDYGLSGGDPVNAMESHINTSARDVAMLEQFGPNPGATINFLRDTAMKKAANLTAEDLGPQKGRTPIDFAKSDMAKFNNIFNDIMGKDQPVLNWAGATYGTARNFVYAAKIIPQAFLSQATVDPIFRIPNLKMQYGLPASTLISNWAKYLPTLASKDARQLALRLGVGGEDILNSLHSGNVMKDHPLYAKSLSLSDFMGRAFAVNAHMHVLPQIMARDLLSNFAGWKGKSFAELPGRFGDALTREGITEKDWNDFRSGPVYRNKGVDYLVPNDVLDRTDLPAARAKEVGEKFGLFVNGVSRETVPAFNAQSKYALYGRYDPNSVPGMIIKDATMATYFTASTLAMMLRGFQMRQGLTSKVGYAAAATTTLLLANAARMQAKALAAGRDPYDMNPTSKNGREFWINNAETSGFAGPTIDLLNKQNLGGVTSLVMDSSNALYHEAKYMTGEQPKDPNFKGKMFNIARHMLPGADGWYTKLLVQHAMLDQVQREVDPQAQQSWQRSQKYYQTNFGQRSWWQPGQAAPGRAPQLGAVWQ